MITKTSDADTSTGTQIASELPDEIEEEWLILHDPRNIGIPEVQCLLKDDEDRLIAALYLKNVSEYYDDGTVWSLDIQHQEGAFTGMGRRLPGLIKDMFELEKHETGVQAVISAMEAISGFGEKPESGYKLDREELFENGE